MHTYILLAPYDSNRKPFSVTKKAPLMGAYLTKL